MSSKDARFKPGNVPHNKGKKGWQAGGRSAETRFKPGNRTGKAARLYQPIGTERITKEGYLQRKVNDDMPLQRRWKMVHRIVWEEHNGPVPDGHVVTFINGDKLDVRIENLKLMKRSDNMKRNSISQLPPELAEVCRIKSVLTRKINQRTG